MRAILVFLLMCLTAVPLWADRLTRDQLDLYVQPPFSLGEPLNDQGVWSLLNSGGVQAGYIFETEPLAPLPGFSGSPINVLVVLDTEGRFMDVRLINHNEPIFVSGLGQAAFEQFFTQYPGLSINTPMSVGSPYGDGGSGSVVQLDGVTKATASVRIAHESIMGATLAVAREKMQGLAVGPPAQPDMTMREALTWQDLVEQGIATRKIMTNGEVNTLFAGTLFEDDDLEAQDAPEATFLDLWIVDLGPPSIAEAALGAQTLQELRQFMSISTHDEPILLIETARHGLVRDDFVRNTAPALLTAEQDGLPVALRDADLFVELADGVPDGRALILRTDRRLGFDPARPWQMNVEIQRKHGQFMPQIGSESVAVEHSTPERFFLRPEVPKPLSPWKEALINRQTDLIVLAVFLAILLPALYWGQSRMAAPRIVTPLRLIILAVVTGFIGWWGQGQLSIVTVLATLRTVIEGGSYAFLLYDPFSLLIWGATILGFIAWGRGLFCGWLCPFGALQEFAHHLGRLLRLPRFDISARWDQRLKGLKYVVLAGLVVVAFAAPGAVADKAVEVEPFKTAITTFFIREWYYVAYAAFWLLLGMVFFKGFCRYVCPLGAVMAIGGLLRGRDWIARRAECGSPCQLCKVKCRYKAIKPSGKIQYNECFQCLDCVTIHDDASQCVPLILKAREGTRARRTGHPNEVPAE